MRLKTRTWALISAVCFIGGIIFWKLGDKQIEQRAPKPEPGQTEQIVPPAKPVSDVSPVVFPANLITTAVDFPVSTSETNLAAVFRLRNTQQTAGQLARNERAVMLRNAFIDTTAPNGIAIPERLRAETDPGSYIVQANGKVDEKLRNRLNEAGAEIVSYVPNNAFLVRISGAGAQKLAASPEIQSVLAYEPYFKLDIPVMPFALEDKPLEAGAKFRLTLFPGELAATETAVQAMGIRVVGQDRSPFGPELIVQPMTGELVALAQLPGVQNIEFVYVRGKANDLTRVRMGVSSDPITLNNFLSLSGTNIYVNVNDTGVDAGHPDLTNRVLVGVNTLPTDTNGHGTHVAGIIASGGTNGPVPATNAVGSVMDASFRGMAHNSKILSFDFLEFPDWQLQSFPTRTNMMLGKTNALISNNSWGYIGAFGYNTAAASFDAAVRDALPEMTGPQPMLFVFAAGNDGGGDENGSGGFPDSVSAPGTAKNVITVGSIENLRNITNEVIRPNRSGVTITNADFLGSTDSSNEVTFFSGRGNVGIGLEGDFGRFKPDVVAPGSFIVSTRSGQWDTNAYYNPTNISYRVFTNLVLGVTKTNFFSLFVPGNAVAYFIFTVPNRNTADPMPPLAIFTNTVIHPSTDSANFAGTNFVGVDSADPGFIRGETLYYDIVNTNSAGVSYDLITAVLTTNDFGDYFQVYERLNEKLTNGAGPPKYRYESGTSMAAPVISGMLALLQEYFERQSETADPKFQVPTPSPALMKALLINSSKAVGGLYDLKIKNNINFQGWGLPDLEGMLPQSDSILFYDQHPTNALGTDEKHVRVITVDTNAQASTLRVSLVWTDPPGNPAVGVKLVNDLDLVVTNLTTGDVYFGNNFPGGGDFSAVNIIGTTNGGIVVNSERDVINNVENVYVNGPLASEFAVSVIGRRVNVNAVTTQTNNIKQDYALVVSIGDLTLTNALSMTNLVIEQTIQTNLTVFTNYDSTTPGAGFSFAYLPEQRVGANNPYEAFTNGTLNQWSFYRFTNTFGYSNVAFAVFGGANLSGVSTRTWPLPSLRNEEADVDLYVSNDEALLDLDTMTIASAHKSLGRGGSEIIILTDAPNIPGHVYYIGVQSEDQRAAEYSILAIASERPFGTFDPDGNMLPLFFPVPQNIEDGSPDDPGKTEMFGIVPFDVSIRRLIVTNTFNHQNHGDLVGVLYKQGLNASVVLNNHGFPSGVGTGLVTTVYNDLDEGDTPYAYRSDGPGSLADFIGREAQGLWNFTVSDNALTQTGQVLQFDFRIEPLPEDDSSSGGSEIVRQPVCKPIFASSQRYDAVLVPSTATNLTVNVGFVGSGTIEVYVRRGALPNTSDYDYKAIFNAPGGALSIGRNDLPPLIQGIYYIMYRNPGANVIDPVCWFTRIGLDLSDVSFNNYGETNGLPLLDDAYTNSIITVTNDGLVGEVQVGVRLDHPRVSDLSLHLVSPIGTRILLFENRGGTSTTGLGGDVTTFDNEIPVTQQAIFEGNNGTMRNYFPFEEIDDNDFFVVSNQVSITNFLTLTQGDKYLNLQNGSISRILPTQPGRSYTISFECSATNSPISSAGFVLGTLPEIVQTGTFGIVENVSLSFVANAANMPLQINAKIPGLIIDRFVVFEQSISNTVSHVVFTENTNLFPEMIKFALPPFGATNLGAFVTLRTTNSFETVPAGEYAVASVVEDWTVTSSNVNVVTIPLAERISGPNVLSLNNLTGDTNATFGAISQTFDNEVGTSYELRFMHRTAIDANNATSALARVVIDGVITTFRPDTNWNTFRALFSPDGTNFTVEIVGVTNGVWIDAVSLMQRVSGNYFYPEESLSLLTGEPAKGDWELEIWDNRIDAAVNANLISWQLHLTLLGNPELPDPPILLSNGETVTETVVSNEIKYFIVDVPITAGYATNTLTSLTSGQLELLFNQSTPPTGALPGDFSLLQTTATGIAELSTNGPAPFLQPGLRYYLGVRNVNPAEVNSFTIRVDFDSVDNFVADVPALMNAVALATNIPATNAMQYFQYEVSADAIAAQFEILGADGNVDLYIRYAGPLPTYNSFDYASEKGGNANESIIVFTSSFPRPLTPGIWYIGVLNRAATPVNYSVRVTETLASGINIIDLTAGVPTNGIAYTGPAITNYYRLVVDQTNSSALFEIFNLSGDGDLIVRYGALPTTSDFETISDPRSGTESEQIVISTNSFQPTLNGEWYLAVVNNEATDITFTIHATVSTNGVLTPGQPVQIVDGPNIQDGLVNLTFTTVIGQYYEIQVSPDLGTWSVLDTVQAYGSTYVYTFFLTEEPTQYYRIRQVAAPAP